MALTNKVTTDDYLSALTFAQGDSERVAAATTPAVDMPRHGVTYYLSTSWLSGFGVTDSGELIGVFSLVKGFGPLLVDDAIRAGAYRLDCFDGFLPAYYARFGFAETSREANWTPGGPDVVYMALRAENFVLRNAS
jgi:hypothetical protein